jgi:glycosyltransferase involved in cell wall biosynthesis
MKFTVMISTMPSREEALKKLLVQLGFHFDPHEEFDYEAGVIKAWTNPEKDYEVLAYLTEPYDKNKPDDRLSYGGKRNAIMRVARGEYVACVDDDDAVHPEYIDRILEAIEQGPDVVGFKVACYGYANNCKSPEIMEPADVSIRYNGWANDQNGFKYVRYPHHLAPTKREHAMAIGYRGHYGEDHDYSVRMQASGRLKTEVHIDEFLYIYLFNAKKKQGQ